MAKRNRHTKTVGPKTSWIRRHKVLLLTGVPAAVVAGVFGLLKADSKPAPTSVQSAINSPGATQVNAPNAAIVNVSPQESDARLSPNAYRDIDERLRKTGSIARFSVTKPTEVAGPIGFLSQFIETRTRVNLSPVLVSMKLTEPTLGRSAYVDKVTAVEAVDYLKSFVAAKRLPLDVEIFPGNMIEVRGSMQFQAPVPR